MVLNKWACAAICLALGGLQGWDSGVLRSAGTIQALVAMALVLPVAALLATESYGVRAAAVAAAFVLLTVARLSASVSLPTLHFVALVPAVLIFFSKVVTSRPEARAGSLER
jgi:hypothetical protein